MQWRSILFLQLPIYYIVHPVNFFYHNLSYVSSNEENGSMLTLKLLHNYAGSKVEQMNVQTFRAILLEDWKIKKER